MNIIIPLGGTGERFKKSGYMLPKPLIKVFGTEIICWLLNHLLDNKTVNKIIIPYNPELEKYNFEDFILSRYSYNFKFIKLVSNTKGACDTVRIALEALDKTDLQYPVFCCDGDNFFTCDVLQMFINHPNKNIVYYFKDSYSNQPIYSYLKLDQEVITDMVEKVKISDNACCGIYCFSSGVDLLEYCNNVISSNNTQLGEYYMSNVIRYMILNNIKVSSIEILKKDFICLGTPFQVKIFTNNIPINAAKSGSKLKIYPKRICISYNILYKSIEIINYIKYLKKLKNIIIINCNKISSSKEGLEIFTLLSKHNIEFDEIYFDQPRADIYINNNNLCDLEKELGYYNTHISPRDFHDIGSTTIDIFVKTSNKKNGLLGEIHWYNNIPISVKDIFPVMINYDSINFMKYEMEKINSIPISKIYLSGDLTTDMLQHIINSINRIHNCSIDTFDKKKIYYLYLDKLIDRYNTFDYSIFDNSKVIYEKLLNYFTEYEREDRGILSVSHGDCVFTNILLNDYNKLKFIDMRGMLKDEATIYGDHLYDFSKVYQSLIGYDEILNDSVVNLSYKQNLINYFEEQFKEQMKDIKMITANLLFTLIPLHAGGSGTDNDKIYKYYDLIHNLL